MVAAAARVAARPEVREHCSKCCRMLVGVERGTAEYALNNRFNQSCPSLMECAEGNLQGFIEAPTALIHHAFTS